MRTDTAQPVRLADYQAPDFLIPQVFLDVRLAGAQTSVQARLEISPQPHRAHNAPLVLDIDDICPQQLAIDGVSVPSTRIQMSKTQLTLLDVPSVPFVLTCHTQLDPAQNGQLMGLFRTGSAYCTQCEAEGFRRIIPFLDRPDVLSLYTTRIEAQRIEAPVLLSNGNLIEHGELPSGAHYALWHDPFPKPSYLFALVGGQLDCVRDVFTTRSGRKVALEIYVEPGKADRCAFAMDSLKACMRWDEQVFGREYDLDVFMIVAVPDFNLGAMENKGLNIFNDKYILALPQTATDSDYVNIEAIIAHEYFHNWTGNRITCRDWFQLCLKEGLTVFRDQEFTADMRSRAVKRIADVRGLRLIQFVEDAGPLAHPVRPELYHEINNFYSATVYEKGAEVIRMLKTLLGEALFSAGMNVYFERFDGTAATVEDFISCFAQVSGRDLAQFMLWYSQSGTPKVQVSGQYDASTQRYTLSLRQEVPPTPSQSEKQPMLIPIAFALLDANGQEMDISGGSSAQSLQAGDTRNLIELTQPEQTLVFTNIPQRPVPSLLRGFSAPITLVSDLDDADMLFLLQHDQDPFNRWQAGQTLAMRRLLNDVAQTPHLGICAKALAQAFGTVLMDSTLDPAFRALMITLPNDVDIAREIGQNVEPDRIFSARTALRATLATALQSQIEELHTALNVIQPYTPDAASTGRRALKNAVLDLWNAGASPQAHERAWMCFEQANNMTDRLAALNALLANSGAHTAQALALFYEHAKGDALVLDKWFAAQAVRSAPHTLERVKELMTHPAFSMSNPNRVRALIGSFCLSNFTAFHRADGAGYALLADVVLQLDPKNPQVAARMASGLRSWRTMEPKLRVLAEHQLRRIADTPNLSADVADVVRRTLQ